MKKYRVYVRETVVRTVDLWAGSREEAAKEAVEECSGIGMQVTASIDVQKITKIPLREILP